MGFPSSRIALLALLLAAPTHALAQAGGRIETDTHLICDTQQQVERFVTLFDSDQRSVEAAIATVNAEHDTPEACVIATAEFRRDGPVATVTGPEATFDVLRITVVGVYTVNGLERSPPTPFFTLAPHQDVPDGPGTVGRRSQD
jgi:hypothetical protein